MTVVPDTNPFSAILCALEISMPWGFMLSTADAEKVEAGRIDLNAVGLVAARRAVRANMVVTWVQVKEEELSQIDKVSRSDAGHVIGPNSKSRRVYCCKQCHSQQHLLFIRPTTDNTQRHHARQNGEYCGAIKAHDIHQKSSQQLSRHRNPRRRLRFLPSTRCLYRIRRLPEIDCGASQSVHHAPETARVMLL